MEHFVWNNDVYYHSHLAQCRRIGSQPLRLTHFGHVARKTCILDRGLPSTVCPCFITDLRLRECSRLLVQGSMPIKRIAHQAGFGDADHCAQLFKKAFGMTPHAFQRMNRQES